MSTLKATYNGKSWFKNGLRTFQYMVTGSAKDIAAYIKARAEARGVAEADVIKDEKGNPLWTRTMFPGTVIKKQFDLAISFNGKIVVDDSVEAMSRSQRIDALTEVEEAKAIVAQKYSGQRNNRSNNVPAGMLAATNVLDTPLDEGAEGGENQSLAEATATQLQGAGTEKLAD